ncbi:hypothetical protein [Streptomyces rhizosphaerihabitans]|uniref:hypothetical protein n=1 Tax=Streptomyces rhizosphaerihabitans TaxID=1266770 RepID=UPI0021BED7CA|nr:hypothetical protein [Streptomyces rhizosphaerihabitans]MCT9007214.1 hypothetical protein [Streptomyces rhizosphaerihabitans]
MGTKTVDEAGAETGTEAKRDEQTVDVTKTDKAEASTDNETEAAGNAADVEEPDEADEDLADGTDSADAGQDTGVGQGAAAVVSAGLGVVSLTGSWVATVAAARESLDGQLQLQTSSNASVATQVKEVYGDAWATTALIGGLFALAALIVGVVVLVRPAFGAPGKPQAAWIKSVAWAGVSLGVVGLVLAVAKYSDVILGLPSAG